ncbi:AsmA family protein [Allorhizobium undicola]|uniref:AsmA family protein n=1 Tax=Allorhizobium undicola TaxID=78527 RepID=UPI003D356E08
MTNPADRRKLPVPGPKRRRRAVLHLALVGLVLLLSGFVAVRLVGPYVVSSNLVRGSMERAISRWSGHEVEIHGTPTIAFWPQPRISLPDVVIRDGRGNGGKVLAEIAELSAAFGVVQAALGTPVFDDFRLTRPVLRLTRNGMGRLEWGGEGLLTQAIAEARKNGASRPGGENDAQVGSITIENGRIDVLDTASGHRLTLDSVFSDMTWPFMSAPLHGSANLLLGGVVTRIDFSARDPLMLFAGAVTDLELKFASPSAKGSFQGKAGVFPPRFASGRMSLDVSDVHALLAWAGMALPGTEALRKISMETTATADPDRLRLEDLTFSANDAAASGIVMIGPGKSGKPRLSGTLAFQNMDIVTFLGAFSLSAPETTTREGRSGLLDWLEFDLSLSARSATLASLTLTDVGASVMATDSALVFDIAESTLAGGTLTGHLEGRDGAFDKGAKLDIALSNADLAEIEAKLALTGPLPLGPGSLTLSATTDVALWSMKPTDITGKLSLQAGPGRISNVDAEQIETLARTRPFFRLSEAAKNDLSFDTLDSEAELTGGAIDIRSGRLEGRDRIVTYSGIIPFDFKGLALSAEMLKPAAEDQPQQKLRFFVGGSWPDLIISPVATLK